MNHLTSDELIDAMDGMLDAARQAHLDACDACRHELADLSSVLREARAVDVPDPSPLFWQHFSERVRTAVDAETLPSGGWEWLRWPVLVPLGAFALVVVALVLSVPRQLEPTASQAANDAALGNAALGNAALGNAALGNAALGNTATGEVALAADSWVLVADLVGEMDWDTASAAGVVVAPGAAEQALFELSREEQQELTRLLRAELQRAKS